MKYTILAIPAILSIAMQILAVDPVPREFAADLDGPVIRSDGNVVEFVIQGRYLPHEGDAFQIYGADGQKDIHILAEGTVRSVTGARVKGLATSVRGKRNLLEGRAVIRCSLPPEVISRYGFTELPRPAAAITSPIRLSGADPSVAAISDSNARQWANQQSAEAFAEALRSNGRRREVLLRSAAEHNHARAAVLLSHGLSATNPSAARQWLQRAAELGSVEAQLQIGDCYAGKGLPACDIDLGSARLWYEKAAESDPETAAARKHALAGQARDEPEPH